MSGFAFEVITLTPDLAQRMLEGQVKNRPVHQHRVVRYKDQILRGEWELTGQGLILDELGKMIDGQHRCLAVIDAGVPIAISVTSGVPRKMFDLIDGSLPRSTGDVLDVPNNNMVAAALVILNRDYKCANVGIHIPMLPREGRILLDSHPDLGASASWVTGRKQLRKMIRGGVLTYCHYRAGMIDRVARNEFFNRLADGVGLSAKSPVLALRGVLAVVNGEKKTERYQLAVIIKAWNFFLAGKPVASLRFSTENEAFPTWTKALP